MTSSPSFRSPAREGAPLSATSRAGGRKQGRLLAHRVALIKVVRENATSPQCGDSTFCVTSKGGGGVGDARLHRCVNVGHLGTGCQNVVSLRYFQLPIKRKTRWFSRVHPVSVFWTPTFAAQ